MDITISNSPLDGSWTFNKAKTKIDIRVSTIPTLEGERVVLRLLNYKFKTKDDIDEITVPDGVAHF